MCKLQCTQITVRHFILECDEFSQIRNIYFHANNMKKLFEDIWIIIPPQT